MHNFYNNWLHFASHVSLNLALYDFVYVIIVHVTENCSDLWEMHARPPPPIQQHHCHTLPSLAAAVLVLWKQQRAQGSQRLVPENCRTAPLDGQSEDGLLGQLPSNLEWHCCCEKEKIF